MGKVLVELIKKVCRDLSFTMEVKSQFQDKTIPTGNKEGDKTKNCLQPHIFLDFCH